MDFSQLPRRDALGFLGLVIPGLLVARKATANTTPSISNKTTQTPDTFEAPAPTGLVGLAAGSYRVIEASPITHGTFSLRLANAEGDTFAIEVCALDEQAGAQRGPARTGHLELFVKNEGHGNERTHEGRGLAVMAFARELNHHEHLIPVAKLLPLRERQHRYQAQLYSTAP